MRSFYFTALPELLHGPIDKKSQQEGYSKHFDSTVEKPQSVPLIFRQINNEPMAMEGNDAPRRILHLPGSRPYIVVPQRNPHEPGGHPSNSNA